jgi:hypothetical protein
VDTEEAVRYFIPSAFKNERSRERWVQGLLLAQAVVLVAGLIHTSLAIQATISANLLFLRIESLRSETGGLGPSSSVLVMLIPSILRGLIYWVVAWWLGQYRAILSAKH